MEESSFLVVPFFIYFGITLLIGIMQIQYFVVIVATLGLIASIYYTGADVDTRGDLGLILALVSIFTMFGWVFTLAIASINSNVALTNILLSMVIGFAFIALGAFISYKHREIRREIPETW